MEHLPIHLPHEASLAGPVQFRWMYPFERFMKSLKSKAKNLARVEGSIVAGSLTEETSHFTSYYFSPTVRTKKTRVRRYDDGGVAPSYNVPDVPDIFAQIGRLAGKLKEVWWESHEHCKAAHNYILRNLDYVQHFERIFEMQIREAYPHLSEKDYESYKERDFAGWLKFYVQNGCGNEPLPLWLHELVQEPIMKITTAPMYFTRGYTFHTYRHGFRKATSNYGIAVQAGDCDFYGILQEIVEVEYPGLLNLKCVLFKCDWYEPTIGIGVRVNNLGVVDVNANKTYPKFDPYILASQAEQVSFITYPILRPRRERWLSVIKVYPRGRITGLVDDIVLQQESAGEISIPNISTEDVTHIDPQNRQVEDIFDGSEEEEDQDEFLESDDGIDSNEDNELCNDSENESE